MEYESRLLKDPQMQDKELERRAIAALYGLADLLRRRESRRPKKKRLAKNQNII